MIRDPPLSQVALVMHGPMPTSFSSLTSLSTHVIRSPTPQPLCPDQVSAGLAVMPLPNPPGRNLCKELQPSYRQKMEPPKL